MQKVLGMSFQTFWKIIQFYWQESFTYRSEMGLWLVLDTVPTLVLIAVWLSVERTGSLPAGTTVTSIIQYYVIGVIINSIVSSHFEEFRVNQIRNGKIDFSFLRPFPFWQEIALKNLGHKALYIILNLPFFLLVIVALGGLFDPGSLHLTVGTLAQFGGLLFFAYWVEFLFAIIIVWLGFWLEGASGLEHFKWAVFSVFSGILLPVYLMPEWLRRTTEAAPFQYLYAVPIQILQGNYTMQLTDWLKVSGFTGVLLAMAIILWHYAKRRYASAGG